MSATDQPSQLTSKWEIIGVGKLPTTKSDQDTDTTLTGLLRMIAPDLTPAKDPILDWESITGREANLTDLSCHSRESAWLFLYFFDFEMDWVAVIESSVAYSTMDG